MDNSLPASISISDSAIFQELDDEVVLLNMANQQYYGLDDVGAQMWKTLLETQNIPATVDRLTEIYDVSPEVLHADLERFVGELLNAGLLKAA